MTEELKQKADKWHKETYPSYIGEDMFTQELKEAYIAGAKENGIQWHDLRKDPNDLPKNRRNVWITYINAYYQTETTEASFRHKFWVISGHKTECEVLAWCEIPKFVLE